jgi:hypothetical protein
VGSFVEGRVAGGAGVDAGGWHMLVIFSGEGRFGALFAEDAELLWRSIVSIYSYLKGGQMDIPFERTACHSSFDFWSG